MFFYLSKILLFLIKPLIWICILMLAALFTSDEVKRKRRLFFSFLLLYLFSNNFLVNEALLLYEDRGTAELDSTYEVGLVLGGFSREDTSLGRTVFYEANDRLMQALKAYRTGRVSKLMISSGNAQVMNTELKEADAVRNYLLSIGVPDSALIVENRSRNTYENIVYSSEMLDSLGMESKVLLFSSAWHLPRVRLCLEGKMDADLFATHFLSDRKRDLSPDNLLVPKAGALMNLELLLKEWVGYFFYLIKIS